MFVMMSFDSGFNVFSAEINELLSDSDDTIYFDGDINIFKISLTDGFEIGLTLDRLIDIL